MNKIANCNFLRKPTEKLDDNSLENIRGGEVTYCQAHNITNLGLIAGIVSGIGALGLGVGSVISNVQAQKAMLTGNTVKSAMLSKAAATMGISSAACAGLSIVGLAVAKGFHSKELTCAIQCPNATSTGSFVDPLDAEAEEDEKNL